MREKFLHYIAGSPPFPLPASLLQRSSLVSQLQHAFEFMMVDDKDISCLQQLPKWLELPELEASLFLKIFVEHIKPLMRSSLVLQLQHAFEPIMLDYKDREGT